MGTNKPATPPLVPEDAKPAVDHQRNPALRAFACVLSYEAGWMTPPAEIVWRYDEAEKMVEIRKPHEVQSFTETVTAKVSLDVEQSLDCVAQRWGNIRRDNVEAYAFDKKPEPPPFRIGPRAHWLRQLVRECVDGARSRSMFGPDYADVEEVAVKVVLECAARARSAAGAAAGDGVARPILSLLDPA